MSLSSGSFYSLTRGNEVYSFEYSDDYLSSSRIQLDPELAFQGTPVPGPVIDLQIFGMFADCCPDRWGRKLLQKRKPFPQRKNVRPENCLKINYLLGIQDEAKGSGGLRSNGAMTMMPIGTESSCPVPPMASLRKLQQASLKYESDAGMDNDKWFYQLLEPGSSLGGARPKATADSSSVQHQFFL